MELQAFEAEKVVFCYADHLEIVSLPPSPPPAVISVKWVENSSQGFFQRAWPQKFNVGPGVGMFPSRSNKGLDEIK